MISAADNSLRKHKIPSKLPKNKWFTRECKQHKRSLYSAARRLTHNPTKDNLRKIFYAEKRQYKRYLSKSKTQYTKKISEAIENVKLLDWKNFKYLKRSNEDPHPLDNHDLLNFYEYFKELYSVPASETCNSSSTNVTGKISVHGYPSGHVTQVT